MKNFEKEKKRSALAFIFCFLLVFGICIGGAAYLYFYRIIPSQNTQSWPTVEATIFKTNSFYHYNSHPRLFSKRRGEQFINCSISYQYVIHDNTYIGNNIYRFSKYYYADSNPWKQGNTITINYNPNNHSEAVVITEAFPHHYRYIFYLFAAFALIAPFIIGTYILYLRHLPNVEEAERWQKEFDSTWY